MRAPATVAASAVEPVGWQHRSGPALVVTVVAGALVSVQARVNGALAESLGAAVPAALVAFLVGTAAVLTYVLLVPRSRAALVQRPRVRMQPWWCAGGIGGATLVASSAFAVPVLGVALLAVCLVAGQTTGGLLVDRLGIAPGGRRPLSAGRLLGAVLAVGAIGLAALGQRVEANEPLLLALLVFAGLLVAGQQAANGQLQRATGDAGYAALVSFAGGTLVLAGLTAGLAVTGALPPLTWGGPWTLYLGGLGGALYILLSAATVRLLGVLRLTLASVAGQLIGGLALDVAAPATGAPISVTTVLATLLTLLAVGVASWSGGLRLGSAAPGRR